MRFLTAMFGRTNNARFDSSEVAPPPQGVKWQIVRRGGPNFRSEPVQPLTLEQLEETLGNMLERIGSAGLLSLCIEGIMIEECLAAGLRAEGDLRPWSLLNGIPYEGYDYQIKLGGRIFPVQIVCDGA